MNWKDWRMLFRFLLIAGGIAIVLRIFVFASFKIPSSSMEPTILAGDYVMVNKLIIGPRIHVNFNFLTNGEVETKRLWGMRKIKRDDVVVFNFPYSQPGRMYFDLNNFFVKRCTAIPGDTLAVIDDFPITIPAKGKKNEINKHNLALYRPLIDYETNNATEERNDSLFMNGKPLLSYTFQNNYYYMQGDNIYESSDSRQWGLLPEDYIVGKVAFIWKSRDIETGKFRWKRMFKGVER
jgi:signal peptidase I